jgi:hypothetical protein
MVQLQKPEDVGADAGLISLLLGHGAPVIDRVVIEQCAVKHGVRQAFSETEARGRTTSSSREIE